MKTVLGWLADFIMGSLYILTIYGVMYVLL